jgi:radical SAM superfamily enzyme YgiQ (UPF0313 family)
MNVTIISINQSRTPVPVVPYGACMTAEAVSLQDHDVRFLDLMFSRDPVSDVAKSLRRHPPDVVGLSIRNLDNNDMLKPVEYVSGLARIAGAVKAQTDATIVLGGSAMAVMPEALLRATGAELGVVGDGEAVFPVLLQALSGGSDLAAVPRVARIEEGKYTVSGNGPMPLKEDPELMAPDYRRWIDTGAYSSRMAAIPLQSKRGCPFPCVYCTYGAGEGYDYRLHSPEVVLQAVERLEKQGFRDIEFVDNVFNSPYEHAMGVCESIAGSGTKARFHTMELNPRFVDLPLLVVMEAAGFKGIGITAESAADPVLEKLDKGYTSQDVQNAAAAVRKTSMPCMWVFMLGGPGETRETASKTVRFAADVLRDHDAAFFNVGIRVYPGTRLETIARREGQLKFSADEMVKPAFYFSPELDIKWTMELLGHAAREHRNILYSAQALDHPLLPFINRVAGLTGISQPLWRYTSTIRTLLRFLGQDLGQGKRR